MRGSETVRKHSYGTALPVIPCTLFAHFSPFQQSFSAETARASHCKTIMIMMVVITTTMVNWPRTQRIRFFSARVWLPGRNSGFKACKATRCMKVTDLSLLSNMHHMPFSIAIA